MKRERASGNKEWIVIAALAVLALIALAGCDDSGETPTSPPMPTPPPTTTASGTFKVVGAGYDETISVMDGANRVFCRQDAGFADLWIRLSESSFGDGGGGRHIDIDLCNYAQGGSFAPHDPLAATCGAGTTWDIWWHDGDVTFINTLMGSCGLDLQLQQGGSVLSGTFACTGMTEMGGNRTLDILDGSFECPVQ